MHAATYKKLHAKLTAKIEGKAATIDAANADRNEALYYRAIDERRALMVELEILEDNRYKKAYHSAATSALIDANCD